MKNSKEKNKVIHVSLSKKRVVAFEGETQVLSLKTDSGRMRNLIDKGEFEIYRKRSHCLSQGDHLPMSHALFFTRDGKALHHCSRNRLSGDNSEVAVPDGIGLSQSHARALFNWAEVGTIIKVSS